ncbi:DnaD domain protein [Anoxybacillus ayderensis G10]|nr:DnaD domain protein [Anoxybacillus ayderensis G10]
MGVIRIQKNSNYVVMSKVGLHDDRLSWKAKGLLAYMLSMPDNWIFYNEELMKHSPDGSSTFKAAMNELKEYGYVVRQKVKDEKGKFIGWETIVYEQPVEDECRKIENRPSENRPSENRPSKIDPLLNNKELNNNLLSNKENNVVAVVRNAHQFYQDNFGVENPFIAECIDQWIDDMGEELVIEAMKRALKQNKPWNYAEGILKDWDRHNLRTLADVEAYEKEFHRKREEVNNREVHKHPRRVGRLAKEGSKSYEQVLREAEEARRAWGWQG